MNENTKPTFHVIKVIINGIDAGVANNIHSTQDLSSILITGTLKLPYVYHNNLQEDNIFSKLPSETFQTNVLNATQVSNYVNTSPESDKFAWSTNDIKKNDDIQIYYQEYNTYEESEFANIQNMALMMNGIVTDIMVSESKSAGLMFDIRFSSSLQLAYDRPTFINIQPTQSLLEMITQCLRATNMSASIPFFIIANDIKDRVFPVKPSNNVKDILTELKTKYAIQIFQAPNGV